MSDERKQLEEHSKLLRTELKVWEKQFGRANGGKRPARQDIKANPDIASKYKEYDKIRDALSGKTASPKAPKPDRKRKRNATISEPSSKSGEIEALTPKKRRSAVESQDIPKSSADLTPIAKPAMIGPTPQKDGRFLGMFDLLSPGNSSQSSRTALAEVPINITATPSKVEKHSKSLEVATPARGSRTPASSSKRFFLESFVTPRKKKQGEEGTPSSSRKLFATPSFLKRDTIPLASIAESPEAPKVFKRRSFGRSLSSRMEELRRENQVEEQKEVAKINAAYNNYEDDLEAMRQMEEEDQPSVPKIVVEDSQAAVTLDADGFVPSDFEDVSESAHEEDGTRATKKPWKKKGLKRQTKRVIMRPVQKQAPKTDADGDRETTTTETKRKSKANTTAHANFRKLKIKNKNSKGKGRYGRKR